MHDQKIVENFNVTIVTTTVIREFWVARLNYFGHGELNNNFTKH